MIKKIAVFATILISLIMFISVFLKYQTKDDTISYNFYVFEREWPASVCLFHNCTAQYIQNYDGQDFNMHGLWPSGMGGTDYCHYYTFCTNQTYDQSVMNSRTLNWMNQYYVGLYSDSATFRAHEFEKHGTCWNDPSGDTQGVQFQNDYFNTIKSVFYMYDLMDALEASDIVPSQTQTYTLSEIKAAIQLQYGVLIDVPISCQSKADKQYLLSIDLCLDLLYNPTFCSCPKQDQCKKDQGIYIPPFTSDLIKKTGDIDPTPQLIKKTNIKRPMN